MLSVRAARCTYCVFFFSSRRRHTRLQGDWSSDVCSSDLWNLEFMSEERKVDLDLIAQGVRLILEGIGEDPERAGLQRTPQRVAEMYAELRSEERRVGKECRSRWSPYH